MLTNTRVGELLVEAEQEVGRLEWEGTFADYLDMVIKTPSVSRLSHKLIYDAIIAQGVEVSPAGEPIHSLFEDKIFGMDDTLDRMVQYFSSSSRRLEIRKRILLLVGPPASGKSSIIALIKEALEKYTRTDDGAVYAIKGCPMQEEPLHLIPHELRSRLSDEQGIYIEGDLCPRCRYNLRTRHNGKISQVPVARVAFSEQEAIGIGYYLATNPNPTDASLLVGSVDTAQLEGDRVEVAGKAYRLDGELNVANRGLVEFVEIFKGNPHLLTTLLGLSQEQLIKMERFGSVYADEVVIAHSNEGDFNTFLSDESSEALRDRIMRIQVPYNLKVNDEVKIYQEMLRSSGLENVHVPPLTLPMMSIFALLTRLEAPPITGRGINLIDKVKLYNGEMVLQFTKEEVVRMKRHFPNEGMRGVSPRYVMNRLSSASTSSPDVRCISPLKAVDSLWRGLTENVSLQEDDRGKYMGFLKDTVEEYSDRAVQEVQKAFEESFEQTAEILFNDYLDNVANDVTGQRVRDASTGTNRIANESLMREMERHIGVNERTKTEFRQEIHGLFSMWKRRELSFNYASHPRIKAGVEKRLFPDRKKLGDTIEEPRSEKEKVEWARKRRAIYNRLMSSYDYCSQCAEDTIEYVLHVLRNRNVLKTPKNEGVEWQWPLEPVAPPPPELPN